MAKQRAIEVVNRCCPARVDEVWRAGMIEDIAAEIGAAVEASLAKRDQEQFGESFTLAGKRIGPNEIYKSTADYVREAKAEAYEDAAKILDAEASRYTRKASGHSKATSLLQAKWEALKRAKRVIRARAAEVK